MLGKHTTLVQRVMMLITLACVVQAYGWEYGIYSLWFCAPVFLNKNGYLAGIETVQKRCHEGSRGSRITWWALYLVHAFLVWTAPIVLLGWWYLLVALVGGIAMTVSTWFDLDEVIANSLPKLILETAPCDGCGHLTPHTGDHCHVCEEGDEIPF